MIENPVPEPVGIGEIHVGVGRGYPQLEAEGKVPVPVSAAGRPDLPDGVGVGQIPDAVADRDRQLVLAGEALDLGGGDVLQRSGGRLDGQLQEIEAMAGGEGELFRQGAEGRIHISDQHRTFPVRLLPPF